MEDVEYVKVLREMIESGAITVSLDLRQLEHIDSPISVQADSNRWIYPLLIAVGLAAWLGGWWGALGVASAGAVAWFTIGRPWHRRRMVQRFHQEVLRDTDEFKKLWRMTGVVLTDARKGGSCASPSGNWRSFVGAASKAEARPA